VTDDYDVLLDSLSTPKSKGAKTRPTVDFRQLYNDVGTKHGVDPDLLYNQAKHESINFNPNFVFGPGRSPKGAAGIAQFMPDTARKYGLYVGKGRDDRFNPEKAADAHARLMKDLIDKYGDNRLALAAYNAGTGFTPQQARRAMQNIPETRNYVQKIAPQGDQYDQLLDSVGQQSPKPTTSSYDTKLSPQEERQFQIWKQQYAPKDSGGDYDLRGAFKAGLKPDPRTGHWPDTFKKPNHPTFSNESQYAVGADAAKAGHWEGDKFIPPSQGDEYDDLLDSIAPLKTPKVSVKLGEGAEMASPEEIAASKVLRPVEFRKGTKPVSLNPVEDVYEATSGGQVVPKGVAGLQARRYEFTPSQEVGERVALPLPKDSVPNEDAVVDAYLGTLGKDYVELGKRYKEETGHNILTLGGGTLKQDDKGNYYVRPTKGAIDFINAYAKGSDVAAQEAHRQADELIAAQNKAYEAAKPDVAQAKTAMQTGKNSPFLRGMIGGTAGAAQAFGSVIPGSLGNEFERQAAVERAASEQLNKESPLTTTGEKVKAGIGGLVPTAAMLIATHKLGPAQLAALGILEGSTPEERLRGGLQGASAQAVLSGAPAAFNEAGLPTTGKIVTGGAMVGQPAFEAWQRGESPTQAIVENLPFAALPFLHSKFGRVESVEDQSGVPKGEIRVREVDNPEATHVIIKPSTMRNQSAIPLKPESATPEPAPRGINTPSPETATSPAEQPPEAAHPVRAETTAIPPARITYADLQRELAVFNKKPYGEWDMVNNRVPAKDNPSNLSLQNAGIEEGDAVTFYAERERSGTVKADRHGGWFIEDSQGRPWGVQGILRDRTGYIEKSARASEGVDPWANPANYVTASERVQVAHNQSPEAILGSVRKVFDDKGKTSWDRVVSYDINPPNKPTIRVMLGIKGKSATVLIGPPRGEFMVEADEGNYRVPRVEMGTRAALAMKRYIQNAHPEITEFKFLRGGSTGGKYGRALKLAVPESRTSLDELPISPAPPIEEAKPPQETPEPPPSTTGIAHRVETAARGEEPIRGKAIGAEESVERGRELLREGNDPQEAIDSFQKSGAISAESMALVRAKHEELARVANQAFDKGGLNSPEFKAAEKARQQFYDDAVKPMQTAWSNTGRAQQGETDIDTGTFYGLYRAFKNAHTREPTPQEQRTLQNLSTRSARAESDVKDLSSRLAAELDKAAGIAELPKEIQTAVKRFIDQSAREFRREGRKQTRKSLDDEAAVIKTNLAAAFQKVKSQTGIQPSGIARLDPEGEITKQLVAYAKNRAKAGVTDAAQLIDDVHSTVKDFADVTRREVAEAILGAGLPKRERAESEWAKLKTGVRQEVKDYTTKEAREALGARLQGVKKISAKDASEVWKYARENYVDQGNTDFADVTQKVASDLGINPEQVRRSLANTTATRRISDEMWKRMADRRQAKQNAESWVRQADQNIFAKRFEDARRLFFIKATLGHGVVAPFTHAPVNLFIPSRWAEFWPNFGRTYKFLVDKGGHEQAMVDLEHSPNYIMAKRAGLANDPRRGYDEYQSPWMAKTLGKIGISGNRAFDSLKTMRQDLFDSAWNRLPEADRSSKMAELLAQEINSSTGASKALSGQGWPSRFLGKAMFAAPLEASRWEFLVRDNARALQAFGNWKKATPEARYMAKRVAARNAQLVVTYASLLAMNQGLLTATKSDDKINFTDPTKSDFLAFKVAGRTISPASGMLTAIRFMGTLASQAKNADLKKPKQAAEDMAKTTFYYGRSKLSPLFSTGADIALRSDYTGRPLPISQQEGTERLPRYSWLEYVLSQQTPIPIGEGVRDVYNTMREQGMSEGRTKGLLKALARAAPVMAVAATGIRVGHSYKPSPEQENKAAKQARDAQLVKDFRAGKITKDDLDAMREQDVLTKSEAGYDTTNPKTGEVTHHAGTIEKQGANSDYQSTFENMFNDQALTKYERLRKYNDPRADEVADIMAKKAWSLIHSDALTEKQKADFQQRINALGITPVNPQKRKPSSPFSRRFLSAP